MAEPSTSTEMVRVPILGENGRISDDYIPESIPQAVTAAEQAAESAASSANRALQQAAAAEKAASSATGSVEQAKTYANNASTYMSTAESHAESAATDAQAASGSASAAAASAAAAEVSNQSAAQSSADAMGFRNSAVQYRDQAREAAQEAQGYVTTVQQLEQNATNSAIAAQNSATSASASAETATAAASHASTSATNAAASAQTASEKAASVLDHYIESATATTLEPGQQATATVADKVLQLGIPKGDKGDPGDVSAVQTAEGSDLSVSTDGGTVTIDDSALRERIAELENQAANVVTGTATDLVSHGEDAFPQKPREVRIKGKTWVNRWPVISGNDNDVTVTTDETGLITISGEPTGNAYIISDKIYSFAAGKQYSFAVSNNIGFTASSRPYIQFYDSADTSTGVFSLAGPGASNPITVPAGTSYAICRVAVYQVDPVTGSFRVMLVEGTEAPDCFTPCASITSAQPENLVTSGKNLLQRFGPALPYTTNGITFSDNGDSGIRISGTATDTAFFDFFAGSAQKLPAGYYVISLKGVIEGVEFFCGMFHDVPTGSFMAWLYVNAFTSNASGTLTRGTYIRPYLMVGVGMSVNVVVYPQLELGSTATPYEPPTVTQTPLPEVELRSLPNGTCDELVVKADGTCEVERRTKALVLNGTENWVSQSSGAKDRYDYYTVVDGVSRRTSNTHYEIVSDRLPSVIQRSLITGQGEYGITLGQEDVEKNRIYANVPARENTAASVKQWFADNPTNVVVIAQENDEEQSPVTLPALPAPTFNQYHDASVPSDTSTEYVRDINIVLDNLAKQVAGTASAVAVREASTIEEE